jgi:predicted ester cyclase
VDSIEPFKMKIMKNYPSTHENFVFYPQLDKPYKGVKGLIESEKKNFDAFPGFKMPIKSMVAEDVNYILEIMGT